MNVALWVVAVVCALISAGAALNKLVQPRDKLLAMGPNMAWVEDFTEGQLKAVGAAELLGAIGLVLPQATGIAEILTPIAAVGLILLQLGAIATHVRRHELQVLAINVPLVIGLTFVAIGRFGGS